MRVRFVDKPENLARHSNLLSATKVIQISPLPDFEHIRAFMGASSCPECGQMGLVLLGYEASEKVAALFGRCRHCCEPIWVFFSEEPPDSPDIIIVMSSAKDEATCKQLHELSCPICNSTLEILYKRDSTDYDIQRVSPAQARCPNCVGGLRNIVFWNRPEYYFQQALALADEVMPCSPRAGLVFLISAFETFLQKAFLFQSTSNKFLVERRKVNFQSLQEARAFYAEFMSVDIRTLITDGQWNLLANAIRDRHGLIHNAGFDKRFERIRVSPDDLPSLRAAVVDVVRVLAEVLESKALL